MQVMEPTVKRFITGPIETNTYVLSKEDGAGVIIDPSSGCAEVLKYCDDQQIRIEAICLTHCHFDHFMGIEEIIFLYPEAAVWVHPLEKPFLASNELNGSYLMGMNISYGGPIQELYEGAMMIGGFEFKVLHVPGHSPGSCAFIIGRCCFSGDTLFAGSIGRFDFPGCNGAALVKNIREKLFVLPEDTIVFPGHGGRTSIKREKHYNPYFK